MIIQAELSITHKNHKDELILKLKTFSNILHMLSQYCNELTEGTIKLKYLWKQTVDNYITYKGKFLK